MVNVRLALDRYRFPFNRNNMCSCVFVVRVYATYAAVVLLLLSVAAAVFTAVVQLYSTLTYSTAVATVPEDHSKY